MCHTRFAMRDVSCERWHSPLCQRDAEYSSCLAGQSPCLPDAAGSTSLYGEFAAHFRGDLTLVLLIVQLIYRQKHAHVPKRVVSAERKTVLGDDIFGDFTDGRVITNQNNSSRVMMTILESR